MLAAHNQNFPLLSLSLSGLFHKCTVVLCSESLLGVGLLTCWAECAAKSLPWESGGGQRAGHRTALCHQTLCQPWLEYRCTDGREKTNCNCSPQVVIDVKTHKRKWVRKRDSFTPAFPPSAPALPCLLAQAEPWHFRLIHPPPPQASAPLLQSLALSFNYKVQLCSFPWVCFPSLSLHPAPLLLLLYGSNLF